MVLCPFMQGSRWKVRAEISLKRKLNLKKWDARTGFMKGSGGVMKFNTLQNGDVKLEMLQNGEVVEPDYERCN
jgi:hypothetical protein